MIDYEYLKMILGEEFFKYNTLWDNRFSKRNRKQITQIENGEIIGREKIYFIFLDTCVWLNLSKKGKLELFTKIADLHLQKDAILLIPEQLEIEWDRNKERVIKQEELNMFNDMINKSKRLEALLVKVQPTDDLKQYIKNAESMRADLIDLVAVNTIGITDYIMMQGIKIPTTDEIKLKALDLALDKKAPFHKNKNSLGDAILFLSVITYLEQFPQCELFFITDNKSDFSYSDAQPNVLHPDLSAIGEEKGITIHYSLDPEETLNSIFDLVTDVEYMNSIEERYDQLLRENLPQCDKCGTLMTRKRDRFDGYGHETYYLCENCHHELHTGEYIEDNY